MNNEDLIDDWDNADYEVFNQWDEEEKNKRLEELEEYFKSNMEFIAKLLTKIDRLNYSLEQANKEIERLNNIINELEKCLEEEKERLARETSNIYEDSFGNANLVNEDIFEEVDKIKYKLQELKGDSSNGQ